MGAARDGGEGRPPDVDFGIVVGVPSPRVGRPDRVHDLRPEHVGQRSAPDVQGRQRQRVHAHVVVFPEGPGRVQGSRFALAARAVPAIDRAVVIHRVGNPEQRPRPLAGLLQQMAPGHGAVVRAGEPIPVNVVDDGIVQVGDEPAVNGDGDAGPEVALGGAEGHVHPLRRSPFGDDLAVADDQAAGRPSRFRRPDDAVVGRRIVPGDHRTHVVRPGDLGGLCVVAGAGKRCRVETKRGRLGSRPAAWRRESDAGHRTTIAVRPSVARPPSRYNPRFRAPDRSPPWPSSSTTTRET